MTRRGLRNILYAVWIAVAPAAALPATTELLKDVGAQEVGASSGPLWLGNLGNRVYFAAQEYNQQPKLFRTDGTPASTVAVTTAEELISPRYPARIAGRLVFVGTHSSPGGSALWSTDGTDAGTRRILPDIGPYGELVWIGVDEARRGFFLTGFDFGDLYSTDGTAANTLRLMQSRRIHNRAAFMGANGTLYFLSDSGTTISTGVWSSDGTVAGTRELYRMSNLGLVDVYSVLSADASSMLLGAEDAQGGGIFRLDLANGSVERLSPPNQVSSAYVLARLGPVIFFTGDSERLWRTDGTAAGTYVIATTIPGVGLRDGFVVVNGHLLFGLYDGTHGGEVWTSDGTVAGTHVLRDITPGANGVARILTASDDRAYFMAGDPYGSVPVQFWVTDGTDAGTRVIPLRGGGSYALEPTMLDSYTGVVAGTHVILTSIDSTNVPNGVALASRLWGTDLAGTDVARAGDGGIGSNSLVAGNALYFTSANYVDTAGAEPWISDGTAAGTLRLRDIAVSGQTNSAQPADFATLDEVAVFTADDGVHGREPWVTNGTAAGTQLLRDIAPGAASSQASGLTAAGGLVYFIASETSGVSDGPGRLWRTDGTTAGTIKLGDTRALVATPGDGCGPTVAQYNGRTWFFGATEPSDAAQLWSTDGTVDGTRAEFTLPAQIAYGFTCALTTTSRGLVFITGQSGPFTQLWRSDGTAAGTARIGTLRPAGAAGVRNGGMVLNAGTAYLLAETDDAGFEVWRTDGSDVGTMRVADLVAGTEGAQNYKATAFGDGIVFSYSSESGTADGLYRVSSTTAAPVRLKSGDVGTGLLPLSTGDRVYFTFENGSTEELWVTDGTGAGTRKLFDHGAGSSLLINGYLAGDGVLFFHGPIAGAGQQLWTTRGVVGDSKRISNFQSVSPIGPAIGLFKGLPLFAHQEADTGSEPWIVRDAAPVAVADSASVSSGSNILVNVRANDTDADSATADLAIAIVTQPAHGSVVVESGGVRYSPAAGYTGADSFEYRLTDELNVASAVTGVSITVSTASSGGSSGSGGGGGGAFDPLWLAPLLALLVFRRRFAA